LKYFRPYGTKKEIKFAILLLEISLKISIRGKEEDFKV